MCSPTGTPRICTPVGTPEGPPWRASPVVLGYRGDPGTPPKQQSEVSLEEGELQSLAEDSEDDKVSAVKAGGPGSGGGNVALAVALYALCSSTLLIINKVTLHMIPDSPFILFCQFLCSSVAMRVLGAVREEIVVEPLAMVKVKPFFVACLVFFVCLLSNTEALKAVNVETVIVVRSCSPIAVAVLEKLTLGKALPKPAGVAMLLALALGATLYVLTDEGFVIAGYSWLAVYFVSIVGEMVFVKFVVENVPMTTWTRVYYNNTLSLPLAMGCWLVLGSTSTIQNLGSFAAQGALLLACLVGVAISYAGFNLRKLVSATSFTVVGVVCKLGTVLINDIIWTKHSNLFGHLSLAMCVAAGLAYEKLK